MAESTASRLPPLTAEQRRAAAGQFERANQVLAAGDLDYGVQLLSNCCAIDPGNPTYRQMLRQSQRARYQNNQRGQTLAAVRTLPAKLKLRNAMRKSEYLQALIHAEQVFFRNPWDRSTHLLMAQAFDALEMTSLAVWTLEQIRPLHPDDAGVNRPLARLYEKRGNFKLAIALWERIRKALPADLEAQHKVKDLAVSDTIAKGRYEEAIAGEAPTPLVASTNDTNEQPAAKDTQQMPAMPDSGETRQPREVANLVARIQANPTSASAYVHLAGHYRRAEQLDKAHDVLQQGMVATNNHFEIVLEMLDLDIEPFRQDLAITESRLRDTPDNAELQRIRTGLLKEITTRELDFYRRRVDRFPTDAPARFEMAVRLVKLGQADEAIKDLQGIRNDPRFHGKALFYLGFCFKQRKNWRLAQRNFEEALPHLSGGDGELHKEALYQLAVGCADSGDLSRAVDLGCELVNLDFGYKNISQLVDTWQAKVS